MSNTRYTKDVEDQNTKLQSIIDDLTDQLTKAEDKIEILLKDLTVKTCSYRDMKDFIDDLAIHGVRFDTSPTMVNIQPGESKRIHEHYEYIKRIDKSIRNRAKTVKTHVEQREAGKDVRDA